MAEEGDVFDGFQFDRVAEEPAGDIRIVQLISWPKCSVDANSIHGWILDGYWMDIRWMSIGWMDIGWMDIGWMDIGWINGWINEWINGWINGWI